MLIRVKDRIINIDQMISATYTDKEGRETLVIRFTIAKAASDEQRINLKGEDAREVWNLLCTSAEDVPYTGD